MTSPSTTPDPIAAQILKLPKKDWVDLEGLVGCSTSHLSRRAKAANAPSADIHCVSISHVGSGAFNYVYRLDFNDGTIFAASVSQDREEIFSAEAKGSEVATMKFIRGSGLYPEVPVPEVHAWDTSFDNPVKAPYVLMDFVHGVVVDNSRVDKSDPFIHKFDIYPKERQFAIVKALARLKAALSKPVPFSQLGSIVVATDGNGTGGFSVGPLTTIGQKRNREGLGGPYPTPEAMWYTLLEQRMLHAVGNWCEMESDNLHEPNSPFPLNLTPHTFTEMHRLLNALIPHFKLPAAYSSLVLHHPDFALRNILFDDASLQTESPKVVGVIDWSGAQILPLMLSATYPADLFSNDTTPFRPLYKNPPERYLQSWKSVPYDWTSIGDPSQYADEEGEWEGNPDVDYKPALTAQIRRFYLRAHFSSCYASQMYALNGDKDLSRATLFSDAPYYLKFHETMCLDIQSWFSAENWVRETYWRLRVAESGTPTPGNGGDPPLVVGPNVYHGNAGKPTLDLRYLPEEADSWGKDESELFDVSDNGEDENSEGLLQF
ncbi:hypothetical protein NMY22_g14175 [Coprinellus aureogranulatus]|nr:hypothetical protein NMY22_g14175 [Coprinellus aureogranulatus]